MLQREGEGETKKRRNEFCSSFLVHCAQVKLLWDWKLAEISLSFESKATLKQKHNTIQSDETRKSLQQFDDRRTKLLSRWFFLTFLTFFHEYLATHNI